MASAIEVKNLSKSYGNKKGVKNLNFSVSEGEIFGYLGPNGAGKTTTIRLLLNFIFADQGSAQIFGIDSERSPVEMKKLIGYLPGELAIYDSLTGKEFLKFMAGFRGNVSWKKVENLANRFDSDLSRTIKKLSHGNKQKIGLINAFMHNPRLVILDEPTNGLDPIVQHQFYDLLKEEQKSGTTIFLSSHNLPEVERVCDRVAIIKDGQLVVVEQIDTLRKRALRPIEVQFEKAPKREDFEKIKGLKNLKIEGNILRCVVVGSLDPLIKTLSKYEILNLVSEESSLEEIFLSYYGERNGLGDKKV